MKNLHVKTDDEVVILSGDDKGKRGKVIAASPKEGKIIVQGVNVITKHVKPKKQGEPGGITKAEGAFYASKAALYCTKCNKATKAKYKENAEGKRERTCAKCGEKI